MSEENVGAFTPDPAVTSSSTTEPKVFDLGQQRFIIAFPVAWANKEGQIRVVHTLKRPTKQQEMDYNRRASYQERISGEGKISDQHSDASIARCWLWDQIAETVSGYPGLADDSQITKDLAEKMRAAHKDLAIQAMFECEAEVLPDESTADFFGGNWMVRFKLGNSDHPYLTLRLRLREWSEKERAAFDKSSGVNHAEQQGKTRLVRTAVNPAAYHQLFDALLNSVEVEKDGAWSDVTVDGRPFNEAGPESFAKAFLGEWKIEIVTALTRLWRKRYQD